MTLNDARVITDSAEKELREGFEEWVEDPEMDVGIAGLMDLYKDAWLRQHRLELELVKK